MLKSHWNLAPAVGAIIGVVAFGQVTFAESGGCGSEDVGTVKNFVDQADLTLMDAILAAEHQSRGKAIHATLGCEKRPGYEDLKVDNYLVCCLVNGEIIEVCVDSQSGTILATHETSELPANFRLVGMREGEPNSPTQQRTARQTFRTHKASDLIGKSVQNPQGEKLGSVQDLAIDGERGRVVYTVLSFGGFLGMGDKWFAIPAGALTLPADGKHFVLAVEKDRLKSATGFDKDRWPQLGNPTWETGVHEFYGQRPYWIEDGNGSTPSTDPLRIQKASEIIGRSVRNNQGENLGSIKDLVIDSDQNRVMYMVLSFGGFMGMGDKLFAIPTGAIQMPGTDGVAVLKVDKEHLKNAQGFDKNRWPNLSDPAFAASTYEFYGQRPYWIEETREGRQEYHRNPRE